jgi:hypothetical protein
MKSIIVKTLSFLTGASKSVLEFIVPIIKDSTANALKEILPIALEVVSSLRDSSKTGDQKRRLAINQIKKTALDGGIDASSRAVNLAIELALSRIEK